MYKEGYKKLFLGMALATFDFNRGNINFIPDTIGYILVILGLSILASQHEFFKKAKTPAMFLAVLSVIDVYHAPNSQYINLFTGLMSPAATVMRLCIIVLNVALIYYVCKAIIEISEFEGKSVLKDRADSVVKFYIAASVVLFVMLPVSYIAQNMYKGVIIIMTILAIGINVMFMVIVNRAGNAIGNCAFNKSKS